MKGDGPELTFSLTLGYRLQPSSCPRLVLSCLNLLYRWKDIDILEDKGSESFCLFVCFSQRLRTV